MICLAPSGGEMAIPGSEGSDLPAPASITLRRNDVISGLDKRLDALAWPADGNVVASRLLLKGDRNRVVAEVVGGQRDSEPGRVGPVTGGGWPWMEIGFLDGPWAGWQPAPRREAGRLRVCRGPQVGRGARAPLPALAAHGTPRRGAKRQRGG